MQEKYKNDLAEIRDMMHRSSRFISLNGWSGIAVGLIALLGVYLAHGKVISTLPDFTYSPHPLASEQLSQLLFLAAGTLVLAIAAAMFFTIRESKRQEQGLWDAQSKRLVVNLLIPLITGGIISLIFLHRGYLAFVPAVTLTFHGLALVNASQYTYKEIRVLGLLIITCGILALLYLNAGVILWAIGFGGLHIGYGIMMQWKK